MVRDSLLTDLLNQYYLSVVHFNMALFNVAEFLHQLWICGFQLRATSETMDTILEQNRKHIAQPNKGTLRVTLVTQGDQMRFSGQFGNIATKLLAPRPQ